MEKIDWLSKHSEASMVLFDIAQDIKGLAKAFNITGNFRMSNTLVLIATEIERETTIMKDATTESLTEQIKRSGESSKAILEAALAGIKLAEKS